MRTCETLQNLQTYPIYGLQHSLFHKDPTAVISYNGTIMVRRDEDSDSKQAYCEQYYNNVLVVMVMVILYSSVLFDFMNYINGKDTHNLNNGNSSYICFL